MKNIYVLLKEIENWMENAEERLGFIESHFNGEVAEEASVLRWHSAKIRADISEHLESE